MLFVSEMIENIVGIGENAGSQHFLFFLKIFLKLFFLTVVEEAF